jgi:signal transduction histidine kinase
VRLLIILSDIYSARDIQQACRQTAGALISTMFALIFMAIFQPALAQDQSPVVVLNADNVGHDLVGHIDYVLDEEWALTPEDVVTPKMADQFLPIQTDYPDFGYVKSAIWLRFTISNQTGTEADWRLFFRENFMQVFNVFQHGTDGHLSTLILQDQDSVFSSRPTTQPELVVPFTLPPGETATFYVNYWSGGSSELSFSILTVEDMEAISSGLSAKNFIYYGMMVILTITSLIALIVARNPVFFAYAGYASAALMFIMHADGNGFKYLWPNAPAFNAFATVLFGSGMIGFGALFSKLFLQTGRRHPIMDKALIFTMAAVCCLVVSTLFVDDQLIKKSLVLLALAAIILFIVAGVVAARTRFKEVRFYILAWSGALVSSALMTSRHWFGFEISEAVQFDSIRMVMVSDAALMGLAIWDRINQLRQASHKALKENLVQAERNLHMNERLQELESRYQMVTQSAQQKDRVLADTLHDLRQPLYALRLNIHGLIHNTSGSTADQGQIEQSFAYLENLVEAQLDGSKSLEPLVNSTSVSVDEILNNIHKTYASDAQSRGLELRYEKTKASALVDDLVLTRVLSNLVANAIKYTQTGHIQIRCSENGETVDIEVSDSGPGLSADEFEQARKRATRLEKNKALEPGSGYGLAIVTELCEMHGLGFRLNDTQKKGTSLIIEVPRA